jgi:hypothetical protein
MKAIYKLREEDSRFFAIDLKDQLSKHIITTEVIEDCLNNTDFTIYVHKKGKKSSLLWRLTLPFYPVVLLILILSLPINFLITGDWGYELLWFRNWTERLF